jgi:hypothetical protein
MFSVLFARYRPRTATINFLTALKLSVLNWGKNINEHKSIVAILKETEMMFANGVAFLENVNSS